MDTSTALERLRRVLQSQKISFDSETDTLTECIERAVGRFNADKGVVRVDALDGNDTPLVALPAAFTTDFSVIRQVEYPVDDDALDPTYLEPDEYMVYRKPNGTVYLRFLTGSPVADSDNINVTYTAQAEIISDLVTADAIAVIELSAYFACISEAQKTANTTNNGEGLDFVDKQSSSQRYEVLGEKFLRNYNDAIFGSATKAKALNDNVAASKIDNWHTDTRFDDLRIIHKDDR